MPKQLSQIDILKIYRNTGLYPSDTAFADEIKVSKQTLSQWMTGVHEPSLSWLRLTAVLHRGNWRGMMAVDMLKARDQEDQIPCTCDDDAPDQNCPKHMDPKTPPRGVHFRAQEAVQG